jgi:hypothetical protein
MRRGSGFAQAQYKQARMLQLGTSQAGGPGGVGFRGLLLRLRQRGVAVAPALVEGRRRRSEVTQA